MIVRAILIDPHACTISLVHADRNDLHEFYELLSHPTMPVFEISLPVLMPDVFKGDVVFVDEDGMIVPRERFWGVEGFSHPLAGKAILTGAADGEGYVTSAKPTIDLLKRKVRFFSLDTHGGWRWTPVIEPWERTVQ